VGGCVVADLTPPRSLDLDGFKRLGCRPIIVTVNGAVQHYVLAYNVTEGWVERYKLNQAGGFIVCGDSYVSELVRGVVMVWWG